VTGGVTLVAERVTLDPGGEPRACTIADLTGVPCPRPAWCVWVLTYRAPGEDLPEQLYLCERHSRPPKEEAIV
jgi:hypothetical protein